MNLPDSGWLTIVQKVDLWVFAAVAAACFLILVLAQYDTKPFNQLTGTPALVVGATGILAFFLFMFRLIDIAYRAVRESRDRKVRRRFYHLSDEQRGFLMQIYRQGSRDFEVPAGFGSVRWFEELRNWRYVEWQRPIMWAAGMPDYYSITEDGWRELEKFQRRSR